MYINQREVTGWEKKGCGIACIAMVLAAAKKDFTLKELVEETLAIRGYIDGIGWKHATLARILTNRSIPSYTQEFTLPNKNTELFAYGIKKIQRHIADNPVIASVHRGFDPNTTATHLVVITEKTDNAFIIQDPDYELGSENMIVPYTKFTKAWRGYALFTDLQTTA